MSTLYAATGDGVVRLVENEGGWDAATALAGRGASCLALDGEGALYAGCRGGGVWKSEDGGESWSDLGLPQQDVFSVAVSPADDKVYAGCEPSMLFVSADAGATWSELSSLRRLPSA